MHRIKSVIPKDNHTLYVIFQNGVEKQYDMRQLYPVFPQFENFEKISGLFQQVNVDVGGYGVSWNDELDLEAEELWENGFASYDERIEVESENISRYADYKKNQIKGILQKNHGKD